MGILIDGVWHDIWYDTKSTQGRFERSVSQFRNWITPDGSKGPSGTDGFKAEHGRYHLYASYACPWAHRTIIFRKLKKLEDVISISFVDPVMTEEGMVLYRTNGGSGDSLYGFKRLHEIYTKADSKYSGRVTVPVLWDKQKETIVSNESSEIIRMLNTAFNEFTDVKTDFYPENLRSEIDTVNEFVYPNVNNGVYRAGFATTQEAYEEAYGQFFGALDTLEKKLSKQRYLVGNHLTEADWRLFTTLVRFDSAYHGIFKCNKKRLVDYPNLWNYTKELYQYPGVEETVKLDQIKKGYYKSKSIQANYNPTGVVPLGPEIDFNEQHDRERFTDDK